MEISYKAVGGSSYTSLGSEATRAALVELFAPSFAPLSQVEPLAGATNSAKFARQNTDTDLTAVISIPYSTKADALAAIKTLFDALAVKNHLKVVEGATTHYYPNAVLKRYTPTLRGVTVSHNFSWSTDVVTATAP